MIKKVLDLSPLNFLLTLIDVDSCKNRRESWRRNLLITRVRLHFLDNAAVIIN